MSTLEQVTAAPGRMGGSELLALLDKFPDRIPLPDDDYAVPDRDFCDHILDGCSRRTAKRYEAEGLPRLEIRGRIFRPLRAGQQWLASRIQTRDLSRRKPTTRRSLKHPNP